MSALHQTNIIVVDADPLTNTTNKKASYGNYNKCGRYSTNLNTTTLCGSRFEIFDTRT